jgi:hypothetical protein
MPLEDLSFNPEPTATVLVVALRRRRWFRVKRNIVLSYALCLSAHAADRRSEAGEMPGSRTNSARRVNPSRSRPSSVA